MVTVYCPHCNEPMEAIVARDMSWEIDDSSCDCRLDQKAIYDLGDQVSDAIREIRKNDIWERADYEYARMMDK